MTLMETTDGEGGDYTDMADKLADVAERLSEARRELFDRVALNVILHNTDDHLRNHGLVHKLGRWQLSPLFDVNPNPDTAEGRATTIAGAEGVADEWDGLMELADHCDLLPGDAASRAERIADAASRWSAIASRRGVTANTSIGAEIDERTAAVRDAASALRLAGTGSTRVRPRGKTTGATNSGSFAPRRSDSPS